MQVTLSAAFLLGKAIWHEIFQILPIGLNIPMPFHSSFLPLFHLKERTTSPALQGFPLCWFFQWKEHRFLKSDYFGFKS